MNQLKISLGEVSECASQIRLCNQMMYDSLIDMKSIMNQTNSSWLSDGAEAIRARFNQFANRFDQQKEIIDNYARFLDRTVESYDSLETTITNNASGIQI